jgi:hypothetical protein
MSERDYDRDLVAKLAAKPEWEALRQSTHVKRQQVFANLSAKLIAAGQRIDGDAIVREVILADGFLRGMKFVLDKPGASVKEIERELAKAKEATDVED